MQVCHLTFTIRTLKGFIPSIIYSTNMDILHAINQFYLESRKEGAGIYPNAILMTSNQLADQTRDLPPGIKIESLQGLTVILTDYIEEPRLLKL